MNSDKEKFGYMTKADIKEYERLMGLYATTIDGLGDIIIGRVALAAVSR